MKPNCKDFDDERPQPKLGNLTTHTHKNHPLEWVGSADAQSTSMAPIDHGYTVASAKLMSDYLAEGQLNPKTYPTKKEFLKHFTTWLIEDDLPFTTGETLGIK